MGTSTIWPGVEDASGSPVPRASVPADQHLLVTRSKDGGELVVVQSDRLRQSQARRGGAPRAGQHRFRTALGEQVNARERQVGTIGRDHAAGNRARLRGRLGLPRFGRQRLRGLQATFADHPCRRFGHRHQHSADTPAFFANRAVGEDEVALLREPVTVQRQHEIDDVRRPALHDALEHRSDDVPDLGKRLARAGPHRHRVLGGTENRAIAVVIELRVLAAPRDVHGEARLEQDAEGGAQTLRPRVDGTHSGLRPVDGAHQGAHLSTPGEDGAAPGSCRHAHVIVLMSLQPATTPRPSYGTAFTLQKPSGIAPHENLLPPVIQAFTLDDLADAVGAPLRALRSRGSGVRLAARVPPESKRRDLSPSPRRVDLGPCQISYPQAQAAMA